MIRKQPIMSVAVSPRKFNWTYRDTWASCGPRRCRWWASRWVWRTSSTPCSCGTGPAGGTGWDGAVSASGARPPRGRLHHLQPSLISNAAPGGPVLPESSRLNTRQTTCNALEPGSLGTKGTRGVYSERQWTPARNCSVSNPSSLRWGPSQHLIRGKPRHQGVRIDRRLRSGCRRDVPSRPQLPATTSQPVWTPPTAPASLSPSWVFQRSNDCCKNTQSSHHYWMAHSRSCLVCGLFFLPKAMSVSIVLQEFVSLNKKS